MAVIGGYLRVSQLIHVPDVLEIKPEDAKYGVLC